MATKVVASELRQLLHVSVDSFHERIVSVFGVRICVPVRLSIRERVLK